MPPIATATSHFPVRKNETIMLTIMQINRQTIDFAIDLFLVSLMNLSQSFRNISFSETRLLKGGTGNMSNSER